MSQNSKPNVIKEFKDGSLIVQLCEDTDNFNRYTLVVNGEELSNRDNFDEEPYGKMILAFDNFVAGYLYAKNNVDWKKALY
jgi:hypothetical protein